MRVSSNDYLHMYEYINTLTDTFITIFRKKKSSGQVFKLLNGSLNVWKLSV